jgi:hypothetical protein
MADGNTVEALRRNITRYKEQCGPWWHLHSRHKDWAFGLSLALSIGTAVAGIFNIGWIAGIFGVLNTAVITVQQSYRFVDKAWFYGRTLSECDRLLQALDVVTSDAELKTIAESYNALRLRESELEPGGRQINPNP